MFRTIYKKAACLGIMGYIVEAGERFTDDALYIVDEWKEKCCTELAKVLGSYEVSENLVEQPGWKQPFSNHIQAHLRRGLIKS